MRLFRRTQDLSEATSRRGRSSDLSELTRLFQHGARRFQYFASVDLPALLAQAPVVLLETSNATLGAIVCSSAYQGVCWIRGLALADGVAAQAVSTALLPALHRVADLQGIKQIYYLGDELANNWLLPLLHTAGYVRDIDVVVFEKTNHLSPSSGHAGVRVRPAQPADLAEILVMDQRCFPTPWVKGAEILGPAIQSGAYFQLALLAEQIAGYTLSTSHYQGRILHLVRIAVDPQFQGRGIAVRLMHELVQLARQQQASTITLNTQSDNLHAQRLYRWFDFQPTGEQQTVLRYDCSASRA